MRLLVLHRDTFSAAPPNQLERLTEALIQMRRHSEWQVLRVEPSGGASDIENAVDLLSRAVVAGIVPVVREYGWRAAAVVSTLGEPLRLWGDESTTASAVRRAEAWACDTVVVFGCGMERDIARAIADEQSTLVQGAVYRDLDVETQRRVTDEHAGTTPRALRVRDFGGLPGQVFG